MIEIKVYKPIDKEDIFLSWFGFEDEIFNTEKIQKIFDENPDEKDFKFTINCPGGSVYEGLRMYDVLRTSGKNIFCNIESECHSMAVVLLLAAPAENRTANPNARALIHEVRTFLWDGATAEELREAANQIEQEQNAILDIYAERTGKDRAELETIMKEEKIRTAQDLLNWGFISKINSYNTNFKKGSQMANIKKEVENLLNKVDSALLKFKNLLEGETEPKNYEHKDADGNVLFTTEKEDDSLAVGDPASPDGEFVLADGRTVVIAEGAITEIREAEGGEDENLAELQAENEALTAENAQLTESLTEATNLINELRNQITSNHKPAPRQAQPANKSAKGAKTYSELKEEANQKMNIKKGGK